LEEKIEATAALMKSIQESKDKKAAKERAKKVAIAPVLEEVETKETGNLTEEEPKKPVRKMKSAVVKLGGKDLERKIDSETGTLNKFNKEANMKQMAVKLMKMGPEVHATYVAEKQGRRAVNENSEETISKSPKETVVGTIVETKDVLMAKKTETTASIWDPRLKRAEIPQSVKALEGKLDWGGSVKGDSSEEDDDFRVAEKEAVQLSFPKELVLAQYRDAEEITVPVLIPPTSDNDLDDMMIIIDKGVEEAEIIQEIKTEVKESIRKAGLMEPPSIEFLQSAKEKGRVSGGGETPTHRVVPTLGGASAPKSAPAPGSASAPKSAPTPGGASAPGSALFPGRAPALRRTPTLGGTSVPRSKGVQGGMSVPVDTPAHGGIYIPVSTSTQEGTSVPVSVAVLGGTSVPNTPKKPTIRKEVASAASTPPAPRNIVTAALKASASMGKENIRGAEISSPILAPMRVAKKKI